MRDSSWYGLKASPQAVLELQLKESLPSLSDCISQDAASYVPQHQHTQLLSCPPKQRGIEVGREQPKEAGQKLWGSAAQAAWWRAWAPSALPCTSHPGDHLVRERLPELPPYLISREKSD